ncbi:hypothetical protein [Pelagibacterium halotolerans]
MITNAIQRLGLKHKIVMITHELTPTRRQLLRDGILGVVIDRNLSLDEK